MLTGSHATAVTRRSDLQRRRKDDLEYIEHLRSIVRDHQVCYEIWPVWTTSERAGAPKGFELMLCGVNGHVIRDGVAAHAVPSCPHCAHTYSELREIAEWVLHLKKAPSGHEFGSFDCALHMAPPHRLHRREIVLTLEVFQPFNEVDEDVESGALKEVRSRLSKLGIPEDVLPQAGDS